ncbi:DUF2452 domain-containing protein [Parvicella tangerina]|uniref:DUF2452 domain-containing protein n=1 Tax=Parvicella tangerina TaxID=2829795 RepID=A0A916NQL4_9FLAO|nr:DUF2452 domain-containing protein [Parvicella tangerina]CAG5079382.1 hypothetical protein CRYO30217_00930 [Parvicella tangerina]
MSDKKQNIQNPIDKDTITETPGTLTYGHHRGSLPVAPTKEGQMKGQALAAMEHQTDMQLDQIKKQMELLAAQASKIQQRVTVSEQIYGAEMRFEPLINHVYHLYEKEDNKHVLSLIHPKDWGRKGCPFKFVATVRLLADHTWDILED